MFVRPKGGRKRAVPIPPELLEPLQEHFASQDAERYAAGDGWEDQDLVWCGRQGQPTDPHDDWEEWKALLAEAGIAKDARLHDARHTAGTLLGEQHVETHVIQRILGHAQMTTTRIYTEPTDPLTRESRRADREGAMAGRGQNFNQRRASKLKVRQKHQVSTGAPPGT